MINGLDPFRPLSGGVPCHSMCPFHSFDLELSICARGGGESHQGVNISIHCSFRISVWLDPQMETFRGALRKEGSQDLLIKPLPCT